MKIDKRTAIELVGVIGIISSLIFVGVQLSFDSRVAISEQFNFRAESTKSDIRNVLESDSVLAFRGKSWDQGERWAWWTSDLEKYVEEKGWTGVEVWIQFLTLRLNFVHFDNLYFQHQQGLLEGAYWPNAERGLKSILEEPFTLAVFTHQGGPLSPRINQLLEEMRAN